MQTEEAAQAFLSLRRIAVAGASASKPSIGRGIAERLRETDHEVFLVHPVAERIGEHACYRSVDAIPGGVEGVVVATSARNARAVVEQAAKAGAGWAVLASERAE